MPNKKKQNLKSAGIGAYVQRSPCQKSSQFERWLDEQGGWEDVLGLQDVKPPAAHTEQEAMSPSGALPSEGQQNSAQEDASMSTGEIITPTGNEEVESDLPSGPLDHVDGDDLDSLEKDDELHMPESHPGDGMLPAEEGLPATSSQERSQAEQRPSRWGRLFAFLKRNGGSRGKSNGADRSQEREETRLVDRSTGETVEVTDEPVAEQLPLEVEATSSPQVDEGSPVDAATTLEGESTPQEELIRADEQLSPPADKDLQSQDDGALVEAGGEPEPAPAAAVPATGEAAGEPPDVSPLRELVQAEVAGLRHDLAGLVQLELARQQSDRHRSTLTAVQETTNRFFVERVESLCREVEWLSEQERRLLIEAGCSGQDLTAEIDFIRQRQDRAHQEILEVEGFLGERLAERQAEMDLLAEPVQVAELRREVDRLRETRAALKPWHLLVGLVLVVVGLAGVFLPIPLDSSSSTNQRLIVETAQLYQIAGKNREAIDLLDEAVTNGIEETEILGRVGELYRLLGEYKKAIDLLTNAIILEPNNSKYILSLARSYGSNGQHNEAIDQYQSLIRIAPTNYWFYAELGHRYRSLKNYESALEQYKKMLELNPQTWQGYHYQAEVYREQKKFDQAIENFLIALEINPNDYWSRVYLGVSYSNKSDYENARSQYKLAIEIIPDRAEAYYYLGEAYLAQGSFLEAVEQYQLAIEVNDDYTSAYLGLGKSYLGLGECIKANEQFVEVLRLDSNNKDALEGVLACQN
jgi:tetratricopeptide (TPR) repeat protein